VDEPANPERTGGRIVVVDDDELFRESLEQNLRDAGFAAIGFADGPSALAHLAAEGAGDVVVLDWKMPGMNGIEVLRRLREAGRRVPVVFLTVLSDQIHEEAALTGGAVDFVEKSRSFAILLKRILLILEGSKRQRSTDAERPAAAVFDDGPIKLDAESGRAYWRGRRLDLTITEFMMLRHLVTRAGKDVRYRELYDLVHGEGFVAGVGEDGYRANVRAFIRRIRQKFRKVDADFACIENYPGFGYRWHKNG
jgi:two-component system response regulator ChvI